MNIFSNHPAAIIPNCSNTVKSSSKLHLNYLQSQSPGSGAVKTQIKQSSTAGATRPTQNKLQYSPSSPQLQPNSNKKVDTRNKTCDNASKPVPPPKPSNLLISSKLSRLKVDKKDHERRHDDKKPKRKGNSLPVMSGSISQEDRTKKSFSLDCVLERSKGQQASSLFQRFVKEASMGVKRSARKEHDHGAIVSPHTISTHSTFFPVCTQDSNGENRYLINPNMVCHTKYLSALLS